MQVTNVRPRPLRPDPHLEDEGLIDWGLVRDALRMVLRAPGRHRVLAVVCFVGVMACAVGALLVLPKKYQVQASVLAQPNPLVLEFNNQNDNATRAARDVVLRHDNLISLLKQTDFLARHQKVRAPAARAKQWLFQALKQKPRTPEQLLEDTADGVEERLFVNVLPGTAKVDFTFDWSDPELAYDFVGAAVQSFLEVRFASEVTTLGETVALLEERVRKLTREISDKTKEVEALEARSRPRAAAPPRHRSSSARDDSLDDLRARLAAKRRALAEMEEFRQRRISELQATLVQQMTVYSDQHPVLQTTRRSLDALNGPSPQVDAIRGDVEALEREVTRSGGSAADVRGSVVGAAPLQSGLILEDPRLEYERYKLGLMVRQQSAVLERIEATRLAMETARAGFKYRYQIVKPPQMPRGPIKPKPPVILLGGLLGGLFFAVFASVAADLWGGRIVEASQIERQLGLRLLGGGVALKRRPPA